MPPKKKGRSKKGRLAGAARTEINEQRIAKIVDGAREGTIYARITKMLGGNHLRAAVHTPRGPQEVMVRIVSLFRKRGVTPLEVDGIVALDVGTDFNPMRVREDMMFDLTAVLSKKQALFLGTEGTLPAWMTRGGDIREHAIEDGGAGWSFGYEDDEAGALFAKVVDLSAKRKATAGSVASGDEGDAELAAVVERDVAAGGAGRARRGGGDDLDVDAI
jgi:hypothetical protein